MTIGIVNYGMGNLASVRNAFAFVGADARIIARPDEIDGVDKLVLPGVGAFGMAMDNLRRGGLVEPIREHATVRRKPLLGLCLGMQLLFTTGTEHGVHEGLDILKGQVRSLAEVTTGLSIPHIGWNDVAHVAGAVLYKDAPAAASYYFVHSYYCIAADPSDVAGTTEYGITFHSGCERDNVFGCQFHPEKSQKNGLAILKRFATL